MAPAATSPVFTGTVGHGAEAPSASAGAGAQTTTAGTGGATAGAGTSSVSAGTVSVLFGGAGLVRAALLRRALRK